MFVNVEGVVTSIEVKTKNDEPITELLLAQQGEREQVKVRLNGDRDGEFDLYTPARFSGRLMTWVSRNSVGTMIMVNNV